MIVSLRLLKFDSVHPYSVLKRKQEEQVDRLSAVDYNGYYQWLMSQRWGMSDFLTFYMNEAGWVAKEVVPVDDLLLSKLSVTTERSSVSSLLHQYLRSLARAPAKDVLTLRAFKTDQHKARANRMERYIRTFKPDVLFIREPCHTNGRFWDRFREHCLIVGFMGCTTLDPWNWNTHRHDLIFTLTDEYRNFFQAEGVESHLFSYGVDERLAAEAGDATKKYDCTFVGYLGILDQRVKTKLMEFVAQNVDFKWWGIRGPEIDEKSALYKTYQGPVAGIEMFRIYKESKIVINEYPEMAVSKNVNMRTMEVLNVGSFLLTRAASNIEWLEKAGALVTFRSPEDCLKKIKHYLVDDAAREKIAAQGLRTALEHFNYRDITRGVMEVISSAYEKKRSKLKPWSAS
jgi:hypothetical protein